MRIVIQPDEPCLILANVKWHVLVQRVARRRIVTHRILAVEPKPAARLVQRAGLIPKTENALTRLANEVVPRALSILAAEVVAHRRAILQQRKSVLHHRDQEVLRLNL
ncbi:hypothetical protein SDC9_106916 [bioreactor metagenome]|uniref:Uncharacterized protein n=1 Tax=bioreactor metagenome TaxID=1076179 RepID=A0A645B3R3_9ZZZZ